MKKVLIISPHFPPVNAADMHRVRQSLPYFEAFGWEPTVLCVAPEYVEMSVDSNLERTLPTHIKIYSVTAFSTTYTRKVGLGNLGLRAFFQLYKKGTDLLKHETFDLIYFSTTMFAAMPLGRLWKRKFNLPFVIDIQDPWRNDYYLTVPKEERPPKFWFAHRLDSFLERFTLAKVDGLIAVSEGYIRTLKNRYPEITDLPSKVLTFGAAVKDFELLPTLDIKTTIALESDCINFVYIGRGGHDMKQSISLIFEAFSKGLQHHPKFRKCKFWFIGTSYALDGMGEKTIEPIAASFGVLDYVEELTDRKPYFEVLSILKQSDVILIPGSDDINYTASKLYPNILAKKPMLCVFHSNSSVVRIMNDLQAGKVVLFDRHDALNQTYQAMSEIIENLPYTPATLWDKFEPFTAKTMTKEQCDFFDTILNGG